MTNPLSPIQALAQWVVVKLVPLPNGKTDKLPIDPATGQVTAKGSEGAHNPRHWLTYDNAVALAAALPGRHTVGFVLTETDPFWTLDIDGALTPTGWSPLSQSLVQALPGTVVEVSLSGRGLHVWGQGAVPPHAKKRTDLGIELYDSKRFIAIGTGAVGDMTQPCPTIAAFAAQWFPPPTTSTDLPDDGPRADWRGPTDDADLLRRAMRSSSASSVFGGGVAFADLWTANERVLAARWPHDTEPFDRSSADAALFQHLAFWTGCDQARMLRIAQQSALVRDKWDREDYLQRTVGNACRMQRDVLQDAPSQVAIDLERAAVSAASSASDQAHAMPQQTLVEGDTFLNAEQQRALFKGCVYISGLHRVLVPGGHLRGPEQFKAYFGGYTFAMDNRNERTTRNAWEAFTESQVLRAPRADGVCFRPQLPYGAMVEDAGRVRANMWWPIETPCVPGDVTPFLNHLHKLLPNERDYTIVLSYMAAVVQFVGVKFQWAPLIQGVEGNGKTFLSVCVAEAIGHRYVHWPKASKIAKQFNGWMENNVFYAVEDIHTSDGQVDVIEELKPMITGGRGLEIERKGVDQISSEICGNFLFNTNHKAGLRKTKNDRRYAVLYCAQQAVEDLARDGMDNGYMSHLYEWARSGGYAHVTHYLRTYAIPDEFNPAGSCQRAPVTSSTAAAIRAGLGAIEQEIMEAVDAGEPGFRGGWVSSTALDKLLETRMRSTRISRHRRLEILRDLGYVPHPGLPDGRAVSVVLPDGARPRLYVAANSDLLRLTGPADIGKRYTAAQTS